MKYGPSTDTTEIAATADAAFAIDLARSDSLKKATELFGRQPVMCIWRMGWCSGHQEGMHTAREILTNERS